METMCGSEPSAVSIEVMRLCVAGSFRLPWSTLKYDERKGGYIVNLDKRMLENAPTYDMDEDFRWTPDYGRQVDKYYNAGVTYSAFGAAATIALSRSRTTMSIGGTPGSSFTSRETW